MSNDLTILRDAQSEKGGSYVGIVAVVHNGEVYRLARLGPFPDGPSAKRAADTHPVVPDDVLDAIASGTIKPITHIEDPQPDTDRKETPSPSPVTPLGEAETAAGAPVTVGAAGGHPDPSDTDLEWDERARRAFQQHKQAEEDKTTATRHRDAVITDIYLSGQTYRAIADAVKVSHQTISAMVKREIKRREDTDSNEGTATDGKPPAADDAPGDDRD